MYAEPWIWTVETAFKIGQFDYVVPNDTLGATWKLWAQEHLEPIVWYRATIPFEWSSPCPRDTTGGVECLLGDDGKQCCVSIAPSDPVKYAHHISVSTVRNRATDDATTHTPIISVITPTVSATFLEEAMASVAQQSYVGIIHWVVIDGNHYRTEAIEELKRKRMFSSLHKFLCLFQNTGTVDGRVVFFGHRINASMSFLVNTPFIAFLDDDNTYHRDHLASMMHQYQLARAYNDHLAGVYCFRNITDMGGQFVCRDEIESLGALSRVLGYRLVDTSCYLLRTDAAIAVAPAWVSSVGDRNVLERFCSQQECSLVPSFAYTLNYRLDPQKLPFDFFRRRCIDSHKPMLWVFHYNAEATTKALRTAYGIDTPNPFSDWQPFMLQGLHKHFQLMNGFTTTDAHTLTLQHIPYGATVLVHLCNPESLPIDQLIGRRNDLNVILFTVESPNVRHAQQWDITALKTVCKHILTYWTPMLHKTLEQTRIHPCHTYGRFFKDTDQLRAHLKGGWKTRPHRAVMVLAKRPTMGAYMINGITLRSLDYLRAFLVTGLGIHIPVDVAGAGWNQQDCLQGKVLFDGDRFEDTTYTVDYYAQYRFVLIIENCDAEGYVSEKLQDAWIAGAVPIYLGGTLPEPVRDLTERMMVRITEKDIADPSASFWSSAVNAERGEAIAEAILRHREEVLAHFSADAYASVVRPLVDMRVFEQAERIHYPNSTV